MPNTGKHEVKSKQNLDGTFELIVEDSEASDELEEAAPGPVQQDDEKAFSIKWALLVAFILLAAAGAVIAVSGDKKGGGDQASNEDTAGFRPYKASGSAVEVPADAPSNEVVEASPEPADENEDSVDEVIEDTEEDSLEDESEEEFVEADEIIGDGEILDGPEDEMLEAAQEEADRVDTVREIAEQPAIRPESLDMNKISESVRRQIQNGVDPGNLDGVRNLSPSQVKVLRERIRSEDVVEGSGEEEFPAEIE